MVAGGEAPTGGEAPAGGGAAPAGAEHGAGERGATSGLGGRVSGGVDYVFGSHFRLGPTAGFAHWLAWSESRCSGSICRDQRLSYGRLLGFATLGLRLTASFGDAL